MSQGSTTPMPLAALHTAMDELSRRLPAFDLESTDQARTWQARKPKRRIDDFLRGGCFVAARAGHYLFVATAGNDVGLMLTHNGDDVAELLQTRPSLLVAALQLAAGDVVGLRIALRRGALADVNTPVRWRGARL